MIFVDSSAWFAVFSRRDVNHGDAMSTIRSVQEQLVTSDYVVDETLTLLQARGESRRAIAFGRHVIDAQKASVVRINEQDVAAAWAVFKTFADKNWSFTDYTSRVVMERLATPRAFAFDTHFLQFRTVTVVP